MSKAYSIVGPAKDHWTQSYSKDGVYIIIDLSLEGHSIEKIHTQFRQLYTQLANSEPSTVTTIETIIDSAHFPQNTFFIVAIEDKNNLLLFSKGSSAYLIRNGHIGCICPKNKQSVGTIQEKDTIILANEQFEKEFPPEKLLVLLKEFPPDQVKDQLLDELISRTISGAVGQLILIESSTNNIQQSKKSIRMKLKNTFHNIRIKRNNDNVSYRLHPRLRKTTKLAGIALLIFLLLLIFFGSSYRSQKVRLEKYNSLQKEVDTLRNEGEPFFGINDTIAYTNLSKALELVNSGIQQFSTNTTEFAKLQTSKQELEQLVLKAQRKFTVEPLEFFNLSWITKNSSAQKLSNTDDTLYVLDPKQKSLYQIGLPKKNPENTIQGESIGSSRMASAYDTDLFIQTENNGNQFVVNATLTPVVPNNPNWGMIIDMQTFGGNIYILDSNGIIWKIPRLSKNEFGSGVSYLGESQTITDPRSMAIDGSIWVLSQTIQKFTNGKKDSFALQGESLDNPKKIVTSKDLLNIYIWDQNRIVVFTKEGNYKEQYVWDGLSNASDVTVSSALSKILILKDASIYSIDLQKY